MLERTEKVKKLASLSAIAFVLVSVAAGCGAPAPEGDENDAPSTGESAPPEETEEVGEVSQAASGCYWGRSYSRVIRGTCQICWPRYCGSSYLYTSCFNGCGG